MEEKAVDTRRTDKWQDGGQQHSLFSSWKIGTGDRAGNSEGQGTRHRSWRSRQETGDRRQAGLLSGTFGGRLLTLVAPVLTDKVFGAICVVLVISRRDGICIQKNIRVDALARAKGHCHLRPVSSPRDHPPQSDSATQEARQRPTGQPGGVPLPGVCL